LLSLLFDPEDAGGTFRRNIGRHMANYGANGEQKKQRKKYEGKEWRTIQRGNE
jgi:hypothetical protein